MNHNKSVKILIAYHKPYRLIKNDIFVPIHVGRDVAFKQSKDGIISESDYNWLLENCIGDNTGDNISILNRNFCELTATYWAWKNYDKLDNPDYIGLMHYRTFFDIFSDSLNLLDFNIGYNNNFLIKILSKYDGIISKTLNRKTDFDKSPCNLDDLNYKYWHLSNDYHKELYEQFLKYNDNIHFKNMFILSRDDFFEYCECLFSILFDLKNNYFMNTERTLGYHAELLSSLFFMYLKNTKHRNLLELPWLIISNNKNNKKLEEYIYYTLFLLTKNKKCYNKFLHYKRKNL